MRDFTASKTHNPKIICCGAESTAFRECIPFDLEAIWRYDVVMKQMRVNFG